jgi:hypothetical protein
MDNTINVKKEKNTSNGAASTEYSICKEGASSCTGHLWLWRTPYYKVDHDSIDRRLLFASLSTDANDLYWYSVLVHVKHTQ